VDCSSLGRGASVGVILLLAGCGGSSDSGFGDGAPQNDSGTPSMHEGGGGGGDSSTSNPPDAGGSDSNAPDVTAEGSPPTDAPVDTGMVVSSSDGFGAARTACVNEINMLRATQSLPAYTLVNTASVDTCVDEQATYDEMENSPHDAWINNVYPSCNGNAQDECEGYGTDPAGIVACLDAMWNEKNYPNCLGCVGCTAFGGACPDCDFSGTMGHECGHYVNMSAVYFSQVWCGFAASPGTWATQNFQ
jgi:hypothetical protein